MYKTIVLPLYHRIHTAAEVGAAHLVARSYNSYIEGFFVPHLMQTVVGVGIVAHGAVAIEDDGEAEQLASEARQCWFNLLDDQGIPVGTLGDTSIGVRGHWVKSDQYSERIIGEYARLFDLAIVRRNLDDKGSFWQTTAEAVLFESGRPLLLVDNAIPSTLGQNIVIAWNGSTEAGRSITASAPLLEAAEQVTVLSVTDGMVSGPSGADISDHLRVRGIAAHEQTIDRNGGSIGQAILSFAERINADLLIKSAFTHSRLRQLVFGGATREIMQNSTLPVLMCH
ncbi:MAG: universal stress protein [Arenicellales bacterium]|jgi:nucleotide-binding universal stress UspA family protein|nr:universal stress protein [Arenicellales bacterium]|tara:strand:+ start:169 stop:1017 length:849 start_codon:yes stop_codon:yes gene_type:complete